jgi:hypothetical protein
MEGGRMGREKGLLRWRSAAPEGGEGNRKSEDVRFESGQRWGAEADRLPRWRSAAAKANRSAAPEGTGGCRGKPALGVRH